MTGSDFEKASPTMHWRWGVVLYYDAAALHYRPTLSINDSKQSCLAAYNNYFHTQMILEGIEVIVEAHFYFNQHLLWTKKKWQNF